MSTVEDEELPRIAGVVPPSLILCFACGCHVYRETELCPHCGADVRALIGEHNDAVELAMDAMRRIEEVLAGLGTRDD